jgi:hypothetical protein
VAVVALHRLRLGLYVVSGALSVGAILRLVLRPRVARSLVVRSRQTDFLILAAAAVAIAVVAAVTPLHTAA